MSEKLEEHCECNVLYIIIYDIHTYNNECGSDILRNCFPLEPCLSTVTGRRRGGRLNIFEARHRPPLIFIMSTCVHDKIDEVNYDNIMAEEMYLKGEMRITEPKLLFLLAYLSILS